MRKPIERTLTITLPVHNAMLLVNLLLTQQIPRFRFINNGTQQLTFFVDVSREEDEWALRRWLANSGLDCEFWTATTDYLNTQVATKRPPQPDSKEPSHVA